MAKENSEGGGIDPISAVANAVGTVFSSVFGFLSSGNQVDIEQKKLEKVELELELELKKSDNDVIIQALKNKQTTALSVLAAAKSEQGAKNLKTGVIGSIVALTLFFVYKIISKPEVQPNYQATYL